MMSPHQDHAAAVTPDGAFALTTEPERLRRWQTVSAYVELSAGGAYRWTVVPGHVAAGTLQKVVPGERVILGWGWDGNPDLPFNASVVTITLEPEAGGTRVTLIHEGLTEEQAASHSEGWNHFFERLEKLAESVVPGGRGRSFADEVTASDNASPADRLAAFAGRVPISG